MRYLFKIFTRLIVLSALLLGITSIVRYFIFDPVLGNQLIIKQGLEMYKMDYMPWNYILYIHIITAAVALIIGPFQFLQNKKNSRHLAVHRLLGKVYILYNDKWISRYLFIMVCVWWSII